MIGSRIGSRAGATVAAVIILASAAGCGGGRSGGVRTEFVPFTPEQKVTLESASRRVYTIQEGDVLSVKFAYEKPLDQERVVVLNDGTISLIGVDVVHVAGLTMAEADSVITAAYSREYREPALSVMMLDTQGRKIYVMGEVNDPGQYNVPHGGIDVMGAIAMASGFKDDAARNGAVVVRVTSEGYHFQEVDLSEFGGLGFAPSSGVVLQPYDIVYVPRSRQGDFANFTRSVLSGLSYLTRMAYDVYNITNGVTGRY